MRQAVEEGFILDRLRNYITYKTYYRVATRDPVTGEREAEVGKAGAAIRRFAVRNPEIDCTESQHRLEGGAGFGSQPAAKPRHPIDVLVAQGQAASPGAVDVGEIAVR